AEDSHDLAIPDFGARLQVVPQEVHFQKRGECWLAHTTPPIGRAVSSSGYVIETATAQFSSLLLGFDEASALALNFVTSRTTGASSRLGHQITFGAHRAGTASRLCGRHQVGKSTSAIAKHFSPVLGSGWFHQTE